MYIFHNNKIFLKSYFIFSTDGFLEYWESFRCLCSSHQATFDIFLERFYLLEWLFLYQRAGMRTFGDENSSRKIWQIYLLRSKEVEDETELWEIREHQNCCGNTIWSYVSSGMVIGNLFCIEAYNNQSYQRLVFLGQLKGERNRFVTWIIS